MQVAAKLQALGILDPRTHKLVCTFGYGCIYNTIMQQNRLIFGHWWLQKKKLNNAFGKTYQLVIIKKKKKKA